MPSLLLPVVLFVFFGFSRLLAAEPKYDINVNVFLTEDGKKLTPPTRANPAYYHPVVAGYTDVGPVVAGEKVPEKNDVLRMIARALANQGYLVALPEKTPSATLLLVCRWGYMNPDITVTDSDTGDPSDPVANTNVANKDKMMALVSGLSANLVDPRGRVGMINQHDEAAKQEALDERYFVIITAYDMKTYVEQNQKRMLWQARMSTPSARAASLDAVMPTLITTGAPFFGRHTMPPHRASVPVVRSGNVDVGTPTVMPETSEKR